ncbi:hypothetical protein [Catenuloplanes atrovinosus]|uniref:Uncharacterized protein n=1 Tax=Catenuloplanes atrovinosus TaxID=137266 RepID=A0AAE3YKK4_9ACTN|nr:hypothetical protein [Catenuloplanes atrovinosus]MDR7275509.1 hypothetical protein [Catenuloplanes atrovinosus]
MPDFFDRLAERAHGVPAADPSWVRPRLPQPFERVTGLEIQEVEVDAPAPSRAAPGGPPAREQVRHVPGAPVVPPPAPAAPPPPVAPVIAPVVPAASAVVGAPEPAPAAIGEVVETVVERAVPVTTGAEQPERTRMTASTVPAKTDFDPAPLAARRVPPVPFDPRGAATAEPTAPRATAAPADPVIRVSIGRLEISAAPPPAERPDRRASRRPDPRISLDSYLNSREAP